ncbi:flagellar hook-associated protein 2 [Pseudoduganella lurida]|uniref:Flagellar hook-associated protein 2 n=1 Tax=Pseudoduganella lurida TaxID=1036180 RepID=A0A562RLM2_9BURK|nr:flagellar filament capping protein FliD [Pseudoduganella lurida]TWI69932.1 flagellar hook-associated protein 2 [Pseudoduganella lurida]
MNTSATSSLLATLYGGSVANTAGSVTGSTTLSPTVAAKVRQALAGQQGNIDALNASLTADQTRLSGLGQLQSALSTFEALAESLSGAGLSTSASASVNGIVTAATTSSAKAGTYKVEVGQLAQGQILTGGAKPTADTALGSGTNATIKLQWGTLADGEFKAAGGSQSIAIDSSNNTLEGIAAAMKKAGVDASVVKGDTGYSLQVKGKDGAAQTLSISVTGDAALKAAIGFDPEHPAAGAMTQVQAAQDAIVTVDGTKITSPTNSLTDAVPGTTLTLAAKGSTTLTVAQDTSQISKNVNTFIEGYNALTERLAALQKGALKGDTALSSVTTQLAQVMRIGGAGSMAQGLAAAGISQDASGKLVLDQTKLDAAVKADPSALAKLFTNEGSGLADKLDKKIDSWTAETGLLSRTETRVTRSLEILTGKQDRMAQALTTQAQALAQLYTIQEQMGGTGTFLDMLG